MSIEKRRDILQNAIRGYVKEGYVIINQTDTSVQMKKPKKFSWLMFLLTIWFLVGILYLIYYIVKKEQTLYIQVDAEGKLTFTKS